MNKQKLTILSVTLLITTSACSTEQRGFDVMCNIYTEALNSNMTKEQLSEHIFDNVKARINNIGAVQAHTAVFNLAPEDRCSIFKESAELSLKREWDCKAMKKLMQ